MEPKKEKRKKTNKKQNKKNKTNQRPGQDWSTTAKAEGFNTVLIGSVDISTFSIYELAMLIDEYGIVEFVKVDDAKFVKACSSKKKKEEKKFVNAWHYWI